MEPAPTTELDAFSVSAQRVVDYLRAHTALSDWSVSRVDGAEQVHLHVSGDRLLHTGDRVGWEQTFCRRMLAGAPNIVPDALESPAYADLVEGAGVMAYAGVPIVEEDGSVFGTLCGVRVTPLEEGESIDRALLELFSQLLSSQLQLVRAVTEGRRAAVLAEAAANSDALTGLMNRRGWQLVTTDVRHRVDALGDHGAVLVIDLDHLKAVNDEHGHAAGDALLVTVAAALREAAPADHALARFGGDEFVVYADSARPADVEGLVRHYTEALHTAGIPASVGAAPIIPIGGKDCVVVALAEADARMYAEKSRRRAGG